MNDARFKSVKESNTNNSDKIITESAEIYNYDKRNIKQHIFYVINQGNTKGYAKQQELHHHLKVLKIILMDLTIK